MNTRRGFMAMATIAAWFVGRGRKPPTGHAVPDYEFLALSHGDPITFRIYSPREWAKIPAESRVDVYKDVEGRGFMLISRDEVEAED